MDELSEYALYLICLLPGAVDRVAASAYSHRSRIAFYVRRTLTRVESTLDLLSVSGATNGFVSFVVSAVSNPYFVLAGMIAILLVLGAFIDEASIMLMTLPFFMPLVQRYGFDPTWYGVIYLMCMQVGLLSPPFGLLIFAMRGVSPKSITMGDIMMATVPYMVMSAIMILAIILVPPLATWLPGLIQR